MNLVLFGFTFGLVVIPEVEPFHNNRNMNLDVNSIESAAET